MKPRLKLKQWSLYRPRMWHCTDGRAEGWGDTPAIAFFNFQRCQEVLVERAERGPRKWKK